MSIHLYYLIKPFLPRRLQIALRQMIARKKRIKSSGTWPIDDATGNPPKSWEGWPEKKKFSLVLSHDVDTQEGHDHAYKLLQIEKELGFRSAFNFVPERYKVTRELIEKMQSEGFEIGIHGLKHDGKLFKSRAIFSERAKKINRYIEDWNISSFTAPSMICNLDWIHELNITHSTSTFDTDPFEPFPIPSKTIFPFIQNDSLSDRKYVELPYTLPQDHSLFIILQEKDISIWKKKLEWIAQKGGMALLNTHPDYMKFQNCSRKFEKYPIQFYIDFLEHIKSAYHGQFWNALPVEVADYINPPATKC